MSFLVRGPRWSAVALSTVAVVFLFVLPALTQGPGRPIRHTLVNGFEAVEGEVLVKYRDDRASVARALESLAAADGVETLTRGRVTRLRSRGLRTSQLLARLRIEPDVEYVEPNYVLRIHNDPNDPMFNSLWGLFNNAVSPPQPGGGVAGADIDAPAAWDISTGSRGQVVGIVDTGIDYNHPDLVANIWSAPSSFQVTIGGQLITCAAGSHGFNTITRTCDPMDDNSHGTHVAGTIGGAGNNGRGVAGVNWTASMMGLKFLGSSGSGYTSDAVLLLDFALQVKARFASTEAANLRVLSNSWGGGGYSASMFNAINAANASDMLFVASAGNDDANNDTTPKYPASYPNVNVLAVASSTNSDQRSSFSNYGATSVHLAAPGSSILSTTPNDTYGWKSGTSMAAPHVSGAGALALSMCAINTAQLKTLILQNVDVVPALSGLTSTGGRLNVASMVQNCPYPRVMDLTVTPSVAAPRTTGTTVTWTAVASGGQGPFTYRWLLYDGTGWTIASAWSSNNTFVWTPLLANDAYRVVAEVRSAWNTSADLTTGQIAFPIKSPLSSFTIAPSVAAPQPPGTTVTWTATAAGGQAPYQYQWVVWDGTAWTLARDWSTSNTFAWTPSAANASYRIAAYVRSAWSSRAGELSAIQAFPVGLLVSNLTLTPSAAAPRGVGTAVTFTATASGGEAPYQYQFVIGDGTSWSVARGWSTSNTFTWTPMVANAAYRVGVHTRSNWNSGASEAAVTQSYAIYPVVTAVALSANVSSPRPAGATIRWTANPSGGQAPYQYQWLVWNGSVWTVAAPWSTVSTFDWTPTIPNAGYKVAAYVRSAWNTGAADYVSIQTFVIQ
jgi:subtilisin family serine protease